MNLVDDATGRTLARLGDQETMWAAADVLRRWIEAYGVPLALYTDWKNVNVREPNAEEQVTVTVPLTQFGRMCADLDIQIIAASSPQAVLSNDWVIRSDTRYFQAARQRHHAPARAPRWSGRRSGARLRFGIEDA